MSTESYDDLKLIDCDAHFTEPTDLWSSRVPASLLDRVPVHKTVDGVTAWYLNGERWSGIGGNTIDANEKKMPGATAVQPFEEIPHFSWDVDERLRLMDKMGVHAQIIYPNGIGFASNHLFAIEDLDQRTLVLQTYNDFLVDVQQQSGGRLLPQAMVPIWDMELTVSEMTRLIDKGITGFTLSDRPELIGLPELPESYYDAMWDLFNESGTIPNFHIGSGGRRDEMEALRATLPTTSGLTGGAPTSAAPTGPSKPPLVAAPAWRYFGTQRRLAATSSQIYLSNVRIITNLCLSDLFDRFPKLRIVSAESGLGWIPFLLESLEFQYDEFLSLDEELNFAKRRPTEYFRDHISVMFWFERFALESRFIEKVGVNNIMVETDIPHPTCLYPNPRQRILDAMKDLDAHTVRRILQDNAVDLYKIDLTA